MVLRCRKAAVDDVASATGATDPDDLKKDKDDLNKDKDLGSETGKDDEGSKADVGEEVDMMLEVILKLREDPEFAKSMYANCPRLQHLLNRNPDLRPIFEDPKLICLNFEKVYQDQGGILPEDRVPDTKFQKFKKWVLGYVRIVTQSRFFKVFKFLLFLKKLLGFLSPMKIVGCAKGCIKSLFCGCFEDTDDLEDLIDPDNLELSEAKIALNNAAEYLEDPDVQTEMDQMMENPESMENAIENNENLKTLRDSNPVCSELMGNPETMRVLTDPDNLRALGDAPECLELDFAGGDDISGFEPPDTEVDFGTDQMPSIEEVDMEADFDGDVEAVEEDFDPEDLDDGDDDFDDDDDDSSASSDSSSDEEEEEEEEDEGAFAAEDFEYEQDENGAPKSAGQRKKKKDEKDNKGNMTEAAVGFIGGAIIGELVGDLDAFGFGGEDDGLDALDDIEGGDVDLDELDEMEVPDGIDDVDVPDDLDDIDVPDDVDVDVPDDVDVDVPDDVDVDVPDDVDVDAMDVAAVAAIAGMAGVGTDVDALAEQAEDLGDTAEGAAEEDDGKKKGAAGGAVVVGADGKTRQLDEEEEESDDDDKGMFATAFSTIKDTAKETVIANFIGDDLAEAMMGQMEEEEESDDDDSSDEEEEEGKNKKDDTSDKKSHGSGERREESSLRRRK